MKGTFLHLTWKKILFIPVWAGLTTVVREGFPAN